MAKSRYHSRSARAADTASVWRGVAERLRELYQLVPEDNRPLTVEQQADFVVKAQTILEDFDSGELESLTEEMRSWADSMAATLESIDTDAPSVEDVDDIEVAVDELDGRADDLESVEFPGMFG